MAGFDPDAYLAQKTGSGAFDPDRYLAAKTGSTDSSPSWSEALGKSVPAALKQIGAGAEGVGNFISSLPSDPLGYKIGRGIAALPGALANEAGGILQYARNLSPPDQRGSLPTMPGGEPANHPYLALTQGDTGPLRQEIATKPLNIVGDVASVAGLTGPGRAMLGKVADAGMYMPRKIMRGIEDMAPEVRAQNQLLQAAQQTSTPNAIATQLENSKPAVPGVPLTAAQVTQDPGIAALEKRSRGSAPAAPGWSDFGSGQNTALFNALNAVVNPADEAAVQAARDARDAATKYHRQLALSLADQGSLEPLGGLQAGETPATPGLQPPNFPEQFSGPVRDAAATELVGDRGALPAVQKTANYILDPATTATAGRTYEARKLLADALNAKAGTPLDEIASAAKSGGQSTKAIKSAIDSSLDFASGGAWQDYLDAFKANSKDVNSVQALNNIRDELQKKIAGGLVDGNGNPVLSRAYINQIIEKHATNKYGDLIAPAVKDKLDAIRATAQQIEAPQANFRGAVTGGGGSDTASNLSLAAQDHALGMFGPLGRAAGTVIKAVGSAGTDQGAVRLGQLLQNQAEAAKALRLAQAREAARRASASTGVVPAALAAALTAQQQPSQ